MARADDGSKSLQQGIKRKRAEAQSTASKNAAVHAISDDEAFDSSSSEQREEAPLDSFAENIAEPVEAFHEAVTNATAFLRPSEQL